MNTTGGGTVVVVGGGAVVVGAAVVVVVGGAVVVALSCDEHAAATATVARAMAASFGRRGAGTAAMVPERRRCVNGPTGGSASTAMCERQPVLSRRQMIEAG